MQTVSLDQGQGFKSGDGTSDARSFDDGGDKSRTSSQLYGPPMDLCLGTNYGVTCSIRRLACRSYSGFAFFGNRAQGHLCAIDVLIAKLIAGWAI